MNISDLAWPVCGMSCFSPLISETHYLTALNSQKICQGCDVRKGPQATVALQGMCSSDFHHKSTLCFLKCNFLGVLDSGLGVALLRGPAVPPRHSWGWAENSSKNLLTEEPSQPAPRYKHPVQGLTESFDPLFPNMTEIKG